MANQNPQRVLDFLRQHPPFDRMEGGDLGFLASHLEERYHPSGDLVLSPREGVVEWLYIVKQGRLVSTAAESSEENGASGWLVETGDLFPLGALQEVRPAKRYYRAVDSVFIYCLSRGNFDHLRAASQSFAEFCELGVRTLLARIQGEERNLSTGRLVETLPLTGPLGTFMSHPALTCGPEEPVRRAMERVSKAGVGSIVITGEKGEPVGIFTLKDLLHRVIVPEVPMDTPISQVMTPSPQVLATDAPTYDAVEIMAQHGFTHLPVVRGGRVVGVVSERDLFSLQRVSLVQLSRRIKRAVTVGEVATAAANIHQLIDQLFAQGVQAEALIRIVTELNDHVSRRVINLVLDEHQREDIPPFTWLSFGSEGRLEQTLKTDQDNGILFRPPPGRGEEDCRQVLLPLARRINEALDECGYMLCKGNIMAGNPECCLSLEEWRARFSAWIGGGTPQHLLNASIFFDIRVLLGPGEEVEKLRDWLFDEIGRHSLFLRFMAENALKIAPPLGFFQDFRFASDEEHPHTINLKLAGATPLVDGARIWGLQRRVRETNTQKRLLALKDLGALTPSEADAWREAHAFLQLLRLRLQREQVEEGKEVNNLLDPDTLNPLDRRILKEVFRQVRMMQTRLALDFQL